MLIAGIGGASLGTELLKCLAAAGGYTIYGCDISPLAFGHYQGIAKETFVVPKNGYAEAVLGLCMPLGISVVIPGAEEPLALLTEEATRFAESGIALAANNREIVACCTDKRLLSTRLDAADIPHPKTVSVSMFGEIEAVRGLPMPCVVKPATASGGSSQVSLATDYSEAQGFVEILLRSGRTAVIQEYLPLDEGEFTIGVLSLLDGQVAGSTAMQRLFPSKLSVLVSTATGLVSTGYSQGIIDDFPDMRHQAESIASALGSTGPLNVQGRVSSGVLIPFEINPRFSASTYLRAMAGFNEVDLYVRHITGGKIPPRQPLRAGYYLRSLTECYVPASLIKH